MKLKDIQVGGEYILGPPRHSRTGCSTEYFDTLENKPVTVITKLNNYNNKNTIQIIGMIDKETQVEIVTFWCSPYDLKLKEEEKL